MRSLFQYIRLEAFVYACVELAETECTEGRVTKLSQKSRLRKYISSFRAKIFRKDVFLDGLHFGFFEKFRSPKQRVIRRFLLIRHCYE